MRMRRIILSSVACLALPYYLKTERFSEKVTEHRMRVLIFFTTFVWKHPINPAPRPYLEVS